MAPAVWNSAAVSPTHHTACIYSLFTTTSGGLGRLAAWHLPGGPVGPPARWAATSNVEGGSEHEKGAQGGLALFV